MDRSVVQRWLVWIPVAAMIVWYLLLIFVPALRASFPFFAMAGIILVIGFAIASIKLRRAWRGAPQPHE